MVWMVWLVKSLVSVSWTVNNNRSKIDRGQIE